MTNETINQSRRNVLRGGSLLGASAVLGAPAIVGAASPIRLSFGHGAAPGNPRSVAAEKFAELVKAKSGGAIEVMVAGSAQLGDDSALLTGLRTGSLAMTANSQGATAAILPELAALGLPFLFKDTAAAIKVINGKIGDQLEAKFDAVGIVPVGWWDNGIRHITNSKRAIRTPNDAMTVDIFQALGAATAQIAFAELYVALQQGVVDGQENPLTNIVSSKLHEVNKFISLSGHKWESTPVLMSKMAWKRLDSKGQAIIREAMAEASALQVSLSTSANEKLLAELKVNPAVAVNEVDLAAFRKRTAVVFDNWEKKPFGAFVKELRATMGA